VISDAQLKAYRRDGFIIVSDLVSTQQLSALRQIIAELVAGAAAIETHTAIYDLEPGHTRAEPKVRRIKTPHKVHAAFDALVRSEPVMAVLRRLIGPDLRLHGSKLNMKSAQYGSPVEWHQDWAFYPHTNDDLLAIGVMLDLWTWRTVPSW
jgi:phytanoyl-CoA hydroxylase